MNSDLLDRDVYSGLVGLENAEIISDADSYFEIFEESGQSGRDWWDSTFITVEDGDDMNWLVL